jgi:hypothetical protein
MNKRILLVLAVVLVLTVVIGVLPGLAHDNIAHCSPGFWKNRAVKVIDSYDPLAEWRHGYTYYDALRERGPGSDEIRHGAANTLNMRFPMADKYCLD